MYSMYRCIYSLYIVYLDVCTDVCIHNPPFVLITLECVTNQNDTESRKGGKEEGGVPAQHGLAVYLSLLCMSPRSLANRRGGCGFPSVARGMGTHVHGGGVVSCGEDWLERYMCVCVCVWHWHIILF